MLKETVHGNQNSVSKRTTDVQNQFRREEKEQERKNSHLLNASPRH